ncbi:MAG: hypothetical protein HY815_10750 [Candidatus Riflebacteria bacterium]|nr:hypothetical protein [Candidatus Riflebacteria bacterium]
MPDSAGTKKENCWEFKSCGRQPGGSRVAAQGTCPAATTKEYHGTHGGVNAGRACWVIAGTLWAGKVQGTFAQKFQDCQKCDFYQLVRAQESQAGGLFGSRKDR